MAAYLLTLLDDAVSLSDATTQNPTDAYVCNVPPPPPSQVGVTFNHCDTVANGMIATETECGAAAAEIGLPWASVAGSEWASGCLFHGGSVYFSTHDDASTQVSTHTIPTTT